MEREKIYIYIYNLTELTREKKKKKQGERSFSFSGFRRQAECFSLFSAPPTPPQTNFYTFDGTWEKKLVTDEIGQGYILKNIEKNQR